MVWYQNELPKNFKYKYFAIYNIYVFFMFTSTIQNTTLRSYKGTLCDWYDVHIISRDGSHSSALMCCYSRASKNTWQPFDSRPLNGTESYSWEEAQESHH